MDDLYDEFGNFIGEAEESEDDSQHGVDAGAYVYDDYPEEAPEATGQELMEIDGKSLRIKSDLEPTLIDR